VPIELALFGAEPPDGTDFYAQFRARFRAAFHQAKSGIDPAAHPQPDPAPVLPAICTDPGHCFGRAPEIARIVKAILSPPHAGSVLILGNAGHGKTMLARTVGMDPQIIAHFGPRRWLVELERTDSPQTAVAEIAQAIGLARTTGWPAVRAVLAAMPALLLLDNLETPLHALHQRLPAEQLLRDLMGLPGVSVLASLRSQETVGAVPWDEVMLAEPLAPAPAKRMFLSIARTIAADDPDLEYFLGENGELAGVALAIHLVAHRVFRAPNLAALKRDWTSLGALLAKLPGGEDLRSDSLMASVAFSLASRRLRTEGRRLFSLLGQLPAGVVEADADALLGEASREGAAQLRAVGLLRDLGEARIGLLPPIRDVAARQHPPEAALRGGWTRHYLDLLQVHGTLLGKAANKTAMARLGNEMPNIAAALAVCATQEPDIDAAVAALRAFKAASGYTGFGAEPTLEVLRAACARIGHLIGQGKCLLAIGDRARMRGENNAAKTEFMAALQFLDDPAADRDAGLCYWGLAEIAIIKGEHTVSADFYGRARLRFQRANWRPGEADCIIGLAAISDQADDYAVARALYAQAAGILKETGNTRSYADCCFFIAEMERTRECYAPAITYFEIAQEMYRSLDYPAGEEDCRRGLAQLAILRDEFDRAETLLAISSNQPRSVDVSSAADRLLTLAELERRRDRSKPAEHLFGRALADFVSFDLVRGQADCRFGLGGIAQTEGDYAAAKTHYDAALALYRQLGGRIGPANCLVALAEITAVADPATAQRLNAQALQLYVAASAQAAAQRCRERRSAWTQHPSL
jgi:tetratricopeptide (TPR) repeat protein